MSTHPSKDRTSWCLFAFKDGRRCRLPRAAGPYLCNFHARREAEQAARQRIGRNISAAFSGDYLSAPASASRSPALLRPLLRASSNPNKPHSSPASAAPSCKPSLTRDTNTFKPLARRLARSHRHVLRPARRISPPTRPPAANPAPPNRSAISIRYEIRQGSPRRGELQHKTPPASPSVPSPLHGSHQ
jgi:hypothetical protein